VPRGNGCFRCGQLYPSTSGQLLVSAEACSAPNRSSPPNRSGKPSPREFRARPWSLTPLTATTPSSAKPCQTSGLEMGLEYVVGIQPTLSVWPPDKEPLPAKQRKSMGRPPKLRQRAPNHRPVLAKDLAAALAPAHLPPRNGRRSPGAMAQRRGCSPVLRQCVFGRRIGIMNGVNRCRSNGC